MKATNIGYVTVNAYAPPAGHELDSAAYPGVGIYKLPSGALYFCGIGEVKSLVGLRATMTGRDQQYK